MMVQCPKCYGTGEIDGFGRQACGGCGGSGRSGAGVCQSCSGSGVSSMPNRESCPRCGGMGQISVKERNTGASSKKTARKVKPTTTSSNRSRHTAATKSSGGFNYFIAIATFCLVAWQVYRPEEEYVFATVIVAGITGVIAGKHYKKIIALIVGIGIAIGIFSWLEQANIL